MSRDYKPATAKSGSTAKAARFLTGLLVGLAARGWLICFGLPCILKGSESPFTAE